MEGQIGTKKVMELCFRMNQKCKPTRVSQVVEFWFKMNQDGKPSKGHLGLSNLNGPR